MVDEYQDTNFIQEQLLLKLTEATRNLCVVGDEDQSLYRFRGATVRNILEFTTRVPGCAVVKLTTNYRSHRRIVEAYDRWMASADWSNPHGCPFATTRRSSPTRTLRTPTIRPSSASGASDERDEAERFADLVAFLKQSEVIADYSQVALLLHSVRQDHSGAISTALEAKGIPAFCPRARAYFDNDEVRLMVACFACIFGYHGDGRGTGAGSARRTRRLRGRVHRGTRPSATAAPIPWPQPCGVSSQRSRALQEGEALDLRPADYFYRLLALEPFAGLVKNENRARNLAIFSQLLNTFQNYYHYTVVTFRNREYLRLAPLQQLPAAALRRRHQRVRGPGPALPQGACAGDDHPPGQGAGVPGGRRRLTSTSNSRPPSRSTAICSRFYQRPPFEPDEPHHRIRPDAAPLRRVLPARKGAGAHLRETQPKEHFAPIWQGLPQWPYVQQELLAAQRFALQDRIPVKRAFSFTGDLKVYETCPRQYQFFREYDFTPSRSAVIFFGLLVHQTIEEIHRLVLDGKLADARMSHASGPCSSALFASSPGRCAAHRRQTAKESAFRQVMNYFRQNQEEMQRVIETEVDVSVEKDGYILTGKVDLLLGERRQAGAARFQDLAEARGLARTPRHLRASALHLRAHPREALRQAA